MVLFRGQGMRLNERRTAGFSENLALTIAVLFPI